MGDRRESFRVVLSDKDYVEFAVSADNRAGEVVDRILGRTSTGTCSSVITLFELEERKKTYLAERGMTEEQVPEDVRPKINEDVLDTLILDALTNQEVKRYQRPMGEAAPKSGATPVRWQACGRIRAREGGIAGLHEGMYRDPRERARSRPPR